jgi:hypothetical protein
MQIVSIATVVSMAWAVMLAFELLQAMGLAL